MNAIGDGACRHPADQDIDAAVQHARERKQRLSQHQRHDIGKLAAVAGAMAACITVAPEPSVEIRMICAGPAQTSSVLASAHARLKCVVNPDRFLGLAACRW